MKKFCKNEKKCKWRVKLLVKMKRRKMKKHLDEKQPLDDVARGEVTPSLVLISG